MKRAFKIIFFICLILTLYFYFFNPIDKKIRDNINNDVMNGKITYISYEDTPQIFKDAIVAVEDEGFFHHIGVSPTSIIRATIVNIKTKTYTEGASTITQQLVKNTLLTNEKTMKRKITEAFYAVALDLKIRKKEILELYINKIYYGQNAYGLVNASKTYFNKEPNELNDGELILLAGLPNAPNHLDPTQNLKLAIERQQFIIEKMLEDGDITQGQASDILNQPINIIKK